MVELMHNRQYFSICGTIQDWEGDAERTFVSVWSVPWQVTHRGIRLPSVLAGVTAELLMMYLEILYGAARLAAPYIRSTRYGQGRLFSRLTGSPTMRSGRDRNLAARSSPSAEASLPNWRGELAGSHHFLFSCLPGTVRPSVDS
jgi:hypothetical protein